MNRRDMLKLFGAAGLAAAAGPATLLGRPAARAAQPNAGPAPYGGPYFVLVHASGGWDPTSLCDPKGRIHEDEENPMNMYFRDDIGEAGNIRYAPVAGNKAFFDKHYQRVLVINSVDTQTNSHDAGTRHSWCGRLQEGTPGLGAVVAGALGPDRPMAFITNGGYDVTGGAVAATRIGGTGAFQRIAQPNRLDPTGNDRQHHTDATYQRIMDAQRERLEGQMQRHRLPRLQHAMTSLYLARTSENELKRLTDALPENLDNTNPLRRQAQLAMASFKAGLSVSANLSLGGFDTHGNHDQNHFPRLAQLLDGVDFVWEEAERQGVADELVVMVASDFGRTPGYNSNNGKDHWSITSVMLMGKGIKGNRVIGETDERHRPFKVNPTTLATDESGVRIEPVHIHRAIRRLAGVEESEVARQFFLPGADLPLLA